MYHKVYHLSTSFLSWKRIRIIGNTWILTCLIHFKVLCFNIATHLPYHIYRGNTGKDYGIEFEIKVLQLFDGRSHIVSKLSCGHQITFRSEIAYPIIPFQ